MELKLNMYVRTEHGIYKINGYINNNYTQKFTYIDNLGVSNFLDKNQVIKASRNIIDLIEVEDIITTNNLCGEVTHIEGDKIYTTCYDGEYCYDYQIQSILTREQFESMSYKVGGINEY